MMCYEMWYDGATGLLLRGLVTSGDQKVMERQMIAIRTAGGSRRPQR
jgi:hypothetical protein